MKNHYMVTFKTVSKINDLKYNLGALHFLGCLSHRERKLITLRWSYKGRIHAFVDSSFVQHLQIIFLWIPPFSSSWALKLLGTAHLYSIIRES